LTKTLNEKDGLIEEYTRHQTMVDLMRSELMRYQKAAVAVHAKGYMIKTCKYNWPVLVDISPAILGLLTPVISLKTRLVNVLPLSSQMQGLATVTWWSLMTWPKV
jgi:hypothetical protein